jgi:hypothetical protein
MPNPHLLVHFRTEYNFYSQNINAAVLNEKKFSERIVCRGCRRIEINRLCAQFCLLFFSHAGKIVSNSTGYIHYTYQHWNDSMTLSRKWGK